MYDELVKRLREIHPEEFGGAWDFAFACQQAMHEAADAIEELQAAEKKYLANISALEAENQHLKRERDWIPVTERLPKEEETVLAFGTLGVAWLDWRHDNKWCCYGGVTHWMPLPTPPTAEEGET